ncbi:hypothetical protein FSP39_016400 [Pinctada imbricata]|uniref:non-specific serine/threonine protein kinase n=1 Tax=Pinctada imbricata TaxID=66713 RepID=A0AA88Y5N4_PINIB|nr:hypothetical protein FSP39_016400 [Pinctada imbricata]
MILRSCVVNPAVIQFFLDNSKFFVLLPRDLTINDLRHPSLTKLSQNKNINVHMLCPGLRSEILHFVNSAGIELEQFYPNFDCMESWPTFLFMCYLGLILQDASINFTLKPFFFFDMLPQTIDKIMPSVSDTLKKDELQLIERGLQRVFYLYLLWLGLIQNVQKMSIAETSKVSDSIQKFYVDLANNSDALKQIQHNFHGFDGSSPMRCMGHHLSINLPQDTSESTLDQYKDYLQFLQKIDFHKHGMKELSGNFFSKFTRAEDLNLSENQLQKIPADINMASFLTHLNISKNEITSLPNEIAELKDTLLTLDISHNPLGDLPACVLKLTSLTQLHATNIGKVSSLRGIKYMKDLEVLCIGYNILESIPDELKDLPLVELDISGVPWFPNLISERINPTMSRFKSIVDQYIAFKQLPAGKLEEIFKSVDKDSNGTLENEELVMVNNIIMDMFPRFGKDQMVNPETGGMPKVVYQMTTLQKLTVEFHCLMEITDHIKHLIKLTAINFSNTTIQSLSPQAGQLNLREIHLQHCPSLKTPPKEVVRRGFNAVYGYLKRLSQGATSCRRTKLMMVGLGGAGKTSLVESLMSSYGTADLDYEEAITDGIDICQWNVPVKGEESIQFSVWDFAGQTVYYNTHQFFLSNRAVYMLVWNIRLGYEHAGLDFWLSSIACHAPKAPILIIGTHCDKVTKSSLPQQELKKAFPQIRDFYFVSSYTGEGISNLQNVLKTVALEQKYMGEKVPEAWLELERKIMKYREGPKKVDLLPWTEVEEEADTCGILDPVEMIQAIEFLHDLGSVIFFNTEFLRGYVVIYPQWIVDVMACIVTVHVGPIKEGKLLHKDMGVVWKKYPKNLHPWLLRLTEEFDLTFPLKDEEANLVPCLLPDTDTSYDWPTVKTDKGEKETKMIYTFKYLPAGLFNRAQVRLHGYSEGGKIWKKGMYLKKNNHIAVILQNSKSEVLARAQGYKPENILYLIHEVFEALIEESYAGVKYDFRIPCIECQNMNLTEPSMFAASRVYRAVELGAPFIQCDNMFHTLSIPELQALMPPDKSTDFDNHLRRSIQELQDINEDININVCFVFHSKNVPTTTEEKKDMVDPFQIMTDLRAHGFLVSFCDTPDTADLGTLTLSFKAAKVVIIGISDEFAADPQCKRLFIFVKETLRMPFLLVVLGNGKEWMKSDLALNISSEVYVKMNDIKRYDAKIKEMYEAIPRKLEANTEGEEIPRCFISYCWANSKSEVDKPGSRLKEGAVGWGDPRKLKHFLSKGGVSCWLDVERVGGKGLFEDIADGLRKAKIIVACVSDEYADSANCKMEFRFAACQLKIPIIIVVVGTGYTWERTEIGMLAVGNKYPKVNLQYENSSGLLDIMKMVQEKMPQESETKKGKSLEEQKEASFQEVLEITQRQFLRQCIQFADSMNVAHYPRLVVVDILHDKPLTKKLSTTEKREEENSECPTEQAEEPVVEDTPLESGGKKNKMCFRLLCEHEEGWHEVDTTIPFPSLTTEDEDEWLQGIAPYAARVLAVLKYTNLPLLCINTPQGKQLQQKYESVLTDGQEKNADFKDAYTKARETVMEQDKDRTCGGLRRCHLLNGKVRWLCEKHSQETGSKTERKYHSELSVKSKEGVSTPHITKRESQLANKNASAAKSPDPVQVQPQVFQMRQMQGVAKKNSHGQMKRQTSQACSVM